MNIFRLADRLKQTPEQIRHGFTLSDFHAFLVYDQMTRDAP
ncbi:hypothetical protein LJR016_004319 [Devosia sp. LjRoot16]